MGVFYFSEHTCVDLYVCISNSLLPDKIQHFLTKCQLDCIFIFMNEIISRNKFSFLSLVRKNVFKNVKNWEGERKKEHKAGGGSETIVLWISLVSLFIWQIQNSFHIASKYFNTGNKIFLILLICKICRRLRSDNSYITISP